MNFKKAQLKYKHGETQYIGPKSSPDKFIKDRLIADLKDPYNLHLKPLLCKMQQDKRKE